MVRIVVALALTWGIAHASPVTPGRAAGLPTAEEADAAVEAAEAAAKAPADADRGELLHKLVDALVTAAQVAGPNAKGSTYRARAVEVAKGLREGSPGYARLAEVLLLEGEALAGLNRRSEALARWDDVTKSHGSTPAAQDAWSRIGDLWFDQAGLDKALHAYDMAAKAGPGSRLWPWAVYRRGWCHVNLGDFAAALADFEALLDAPGTDPYLLKVRAEAEKDWVFAYAAASDPADAPKRVAERFPGRERPMLLRLADSYDQQGRTQHAIRQWRALVERAAIPERVDLLVRVVRGTLAMGDLRGTVSAIDELTRLIKGARPSKDVTQADLAGPDAAAETLVRQICVDWVSEHRKTRDREQATRAIDVCGLYLELWPHAAMAPEVRLSRGSALLDAGRKAEAIVELEAAESTHPVAASRDAARMLLDRARSR
ncbi:MAG: hypothetical protein AMXMBFR64_21140 [Myxococcales bacterium]